MSAHSTKNAPKTATKTMLVRLALGTMLDVGPHGPEALPPGHPMAGHFDVYQWLTVLQEYLVLGLMGKS